MPQRIRSKVKFKGDLQPQALNIKNSNAKCKAVRASMYAGKIHVTLSGGCSIASGKAVILGGVPFPIRMVDAHYFARVTTGASAIQIANTSVIGTAGIAAFRISGYKPASYTRGYPVSAGLVGRANAVSLTNTIVTGSQIGIGASFDAASVHGLLVIDYVPYES